MTRGAYVGVSSAVKKVKEIYVGVGSTAKKVKEGYVGIGGVVKKFWPNIVPAGQKIFTTSGNWTVPAGVTKVDVFCVGGGSAPVFDDSATMSKAGGSSGYTTTQKNITVTPGANVSIVVGAGASPGAFNEGGQSSCLGVIAKGGIAKKLNASDEKIYNGGGSGGGMSGSADIDSMTLTSPGNGGEDGSDGGKHGSYGTVGLSYGEGQHTTTRAFGESTGTLYAGGGGGGAVSHKSNYSHTWTDCSIGGSGGGGDGGYINSGNVVPAGDGIPNTGGGGGGGALYKYRSPSSGKDTYTMGANGKGGSGVVIIRWGEQ